MKNKLKSLIKTKENKPYLELVSFVYEQRQPTEHIVITKESHYKGNLLLYINGQEHQDFSVANNVSVDYFNALEEKKTPVYSPGIKGLLEKLNLKTPRYQKSYIPKDIKVELFIFQSSKKNLEDLKPEEIERLKKEAVRA